MSVYLALEEEFGVKIPDDDLHLLSTVKQIGEYITSKK
jgi:acyl carrier protein